MTDIRKAMQMALDALTKCIGRHYDLAEDVNIGDAIEALRTELARVQESESVAWTKDAMEYGNALNEAGWALVQALPKGSLTDDGFTNLKPALRVAILKYAELTAPQPMKFVPVDSSLRNENWNHPNDTEPCDQACQSALDARGDDKGQGLDGYWKWGFKAGWNAAKSKPQTVQEPVAWVSVAKGDVSKALLYFDKGELIRPLGVIGEETTREKLIQAGDTK